MKQNMSKKLNNFRLCDYQWAFLHEKSEKKGQRQNVNFFLKI